LKNLGIQFGPPTDPVKAVDGISFAMAAARRWPSWAKVASGKSAERGWP